MHLDRYVSHWARFKPADPVLVWKGDPVRWGEFDAQAAGVASYLSELGVGRGDRIGCLAPNCVEWCVAVAAAVKIGAIFVPLNHLFGTLELQQIARDAECAAVISIPSLIGKLPRVRERGVGEDMLIYDLAGDRLPFPFAAAAASGRRPERHEHPDSDVFAICYTSGTTGVPKGVQLTHRQVELMALGYILGFGWTGADRQLMLAPLAFTGGIITNLTPIFVVGCTGYLENGADAARALRLIVEERITIFGGVPALYQRMTEAPDFADADLSCLKACVTGGARVSRELLETFGRKGVVIRQQYGCTECCGCVASPPREVALARPESCGFPVPSLEFSLFDDDARPVPQGTVGEIYVRGDQVMPGYWRNPEATAAAMHGDWYKTGDLGLLNPQGELVVVDRKKNMIITGGVNVYPAEIERAVSAIDGVVEVVAFGMPSPAWGEEVVLVAYGPALPDAAQLQRHARELLGAYKAPKQVRISQIPLPKTASNKIGRAGLSELWESLTPPITVAA